MQGAAVHEVEGAPSPGAVSRRPPLRTISPSQLAVALWRSAERDDAPAADRNRAAIHDLDPLIALNHGSREDRDRLALAHAQIGDAGRRRRNGGA